MNKLAVWYKDSKGVDHYGTPSNSSESASVATSTQPTGDLSSGGSKGSSGGSKNSNTNTNTNTTYTPYLDGESDYARTVRALNNYANSGNTNAYLNAVNYANSQGWSDMVPSIMPSTLKGSSGNSELIPTTTTQPTSQIQQVQDLINSMAQNQQQYTPVQPDYSSILPMATGVSATADPTQTTFLPTTHYYDRVTQAKNQIDNATNAANSTNLASYNAEQNQRQNQLSNLLSLLPYTTTTAAQQAELDNQKATNALNQQIQAQKQQQQEFENGIKQQQIDNDTRKTDYDISRPYSTGSSGSKDNMSYATALTRATEMAKADPRLAGQIINDTDEFGMARKRQTQADGVNYFSLPQLIDAYMTQLAYETQQ